MSPLEWALVLQALYFFGIHFVVSEGKFLWQYEIEHPEELLLTGLIGEFPSLPLVFTLLSLVVYPTSWVFFWLVANIVWMLLVGLSEKIILAVIIGIIGFVVLLVDFKLMKLASGVSNNITSSTAPSVAQISSENELWLLLVKILIALVSVLGILLLLRWAIKEFLPDFDPNVILQKVIITVVSGVLVTTLVYWFFGDPTVATIPGLAAAAGLYLLNRQA